MADYKLSVAAADLNEAIEKANNAAPQATVYTKSEIDELVKGYGEAIPANSDLNNYVDNGQYYIQNTTIWRSLLNVPTSGETNGRLIVMGLNASSSIRCTQLLIPNFSNSNTPGMVFIRQLYGEDLWTAWYKFEGTEMT